MMIRMWVLLYPMFASNAKSVMVSPSLLLADMEHVGSPIPALLDSSDVDMTISGMSLSICWTHILEYVIL